MQTLLAAEMALNTSLTLSLILSSSHAETIEPNRAKNLSGCQRWTARRYKSCPNISAQAQTLVHCWNTFLSAGVAPGGIQSTFDAFGGTCNESKRMNLESVSDFSIQR